MYDQSKVHSTYLIDVDSFPETYASHPGPLCPLGAREVDQVQLRGEQVNLAGPRTGRELLLHGDDEDGVGAAGGLVHRGRPGRSRGMDIINGDIFRFITLILILVITG